MTNNAGDLIDEASGVIVRDIVDGAYQFVSIAHTIVVLQWFSVQDGSELDLEGELAVIN